LFKALTNDKRANIIESSRSLRKPLTSDQSKPKRSGGRQPKRPTTPKTKGNKNPITHIGDYVKVLKDKLDWDLKYDEKKKRKFIISEDGEITVNEDEKGGMFHGYRFLFINPFIQTKSEEKNQNLRKLRTNQISGWIKVRMSKSFDLGALIQDRFHSTGVNKTTHIFLPENFTKKIDPKVWDEILKSIEASGDGMGKLSLEELRDWSKEGMIVQEKWFVFCTRYHRLPEGREKGDKEYWAEVPEEKSATQIGR
jgi:hypothetical protein